MTLNIHEIVNAASRVTHTPAKVITGRRRSSELVLIRDAIAALSKDYLYRTDDAISKTLNRHRSAICYGLKRHDKKILTNKYYKKLYEKIREEAKLDPVEA